MQVKEGKSTTSYESAVPGEGKSTTSYESAVRAVFVGLGQELVEFDFLTNLHVGY